MTNETKSIIEKSLTEVFNSVYIGLAEEMSPNDIEFDKELEARGSEAAEMLYKEIAEYI